VSDYSIAKLLNFLTVIPSLLTLCLAVSKPYCPTINMGHSLIAKNNYYPVAPAASLSD
jgi:hypothetical protein